MVIRDCPLCSLAHTHADTHTPLAADEESDYSYQQHVGDIYAATLARLKATDIDQEVKEMAITCM